MAAEAEKKADGGAATPAERAEQKLSNAALKAKAKAEKAARRAASKAAAPSTPQQGDGKAAGGKAKGKQDSSQAPTQKPDKAHTKHSETGPVEKPAKKKPTLPECFSHLPVPKRVSTTEAEKDVHKAVLTLGQLMSSFTIRDSVARVETTLLAFKKVVETYETPPGNTLSRHFTAHVLNPQIEYLTECRPLCFSMGNAIRWLKLQVSKIDIELSDDEAKKQLCEAIDKFILQKVTIGDRVIAENAANRIADDDVILVYGRHHLVEGTLLKAQRRDKQFRVVVVDDAFEPTGAAMAGRLRNVDIDVTYCPDLTAATVMAHHSTKTIVAAEAVFEDGSVYARAGTCDIALATREAGNDLLVLCQSINFTDRMPTDSFTYNEVDPEMATSSGLRLLYDITKPEDVSLIVLEDGGIRSHMIPTILKKFDFL